ncbi:flavin reductase [Leptolyngbya sp. FACHB-541]|uniref:diflavin flavoprotein n=1 Tax=Leptolyngbya sp. FACHB-541 TaxID=2692810 RepID=UPI0016876DE4|nr:diflavin flavoprotein [Leptolyngbya sp. FACHB-541]MBD1995585.1 flavin reductase [Leptolyngbya sp. FACHB-541]
MLHNTLAQGQRDVQVAEIGLHTTILRSRTWDRLKFEVEYARQRGTTANSYLIWGDRTALIDPPGESFTQIFVQELEHQIDLAKLDYIILSHVNPNRIATLTALLEKAPQVTIVCSKPAAIALKATHFNGKIQVVRLDDTLELGQGHHLQFIPVPTPRWADGLCTYDPQTQMLYTDKLFGVHLCADEIFDENWKQLDDDRRYYFDCLYAAQAKQVEAALDKIAPFSAKAYAPGHGAIVRYSLSRLSHDYRQWCQQQKSQELRVALLYASAYGNTATLAQAIAQGLIRSGVAVEAINCEQAEPTEITRLVEMCDGFIIGSPTLGGHAPTQIQTALGLVLSAAAKTKLAGVFGSYGWSGEAIDLIETKLQDVNYRFGFEPIRVRFSPDATTLQTCEAAGAEFAQALKTTRKLRSPRQVIAPTQTDRTAQAIGRVVGSLCVVTTRSGDDHSGILTSWASQASFNPPGLMLSVAADQNAERLTSPGDRFVLNILKEGRNLRRHFSSHSQPGMNPFATLDTQIASNGCLILNDALAFVECTVQQRMSCGDRWLIYATVDSGQVLEPKGITAIAHRKSGSST